MNGKLFVQAIIKFISGAVMVALMIFLPAGSLDYWNGWLLMGILFIPMFTAGIIPMYLVTILLFLAMPLVLGSLISFLIFLVYPMILSKRIRNEEKVLEEQLAGYKEYKQKVKYKLIPFVW